MNDKTAASPFLPGTLQLSDELSHLPVSSTQLQGLTLAVKDLFHMAGLATTAGNPDWLNTHQTPSATNTAVLSLLSHGAKFVGKTITDELAYSLNGQNIHYGTPTNPINPDRLPGGSSSGSAVAVSSHQANIGLGTDTGGSIRVPASYNGLFGLRPTHGAVSCDNMVALAPSFDTVGWMTRSIDELKKVAQALLPAPSNIVHKDKLGVANTVIDQVEHSEQINHWLSTLSQFNLVDVALDPDQLGTSDAFRVLQGSEIWQTHGQWLTDENPSIADDIQIRLDWCRTLSASQIDSAKQQQQHIIHAVDALLSEVDAIILPTTPGLAPKLDMDADALAQYRNQLLAMTAVAGLCGLPQLHLPMFTLHGAPCGVSLIGPRGSDFALIALAETILEK